MITIPRATAGMDYLPGTERECLNHTPRFFTGYNPPPDIPDTEELMASMGARPFSDFADELWIEPNEWKDYSDWLDDKEMSAEHTRIRCGRFTNQSPTHECTTHSLFQGWEQAWSVATGGNPTLAVWMSILSVYPIANPGQWGGAGCIQVLKILMERGGLPDKINGQDSKFKHTMHGTRGKGVPRKQSTGPWVNERSNPEYFKGDCEETRDLFKPVPADIVYPQSREEMACCILHRRCVNVGRRGHAIPKNRLVWVNKSDKYPALAYPDSYEVVRMDSWNAVSQEVGGSSVIWTPKLWDDWKDPYGEN